MKFAKPAHLALAMLCFSVGAADAAERLRGVVELFTSQGCMSCPPADDNLAALARRGDVVALAYHVTYWDYRGWRDTLATAEGTARQQSYREAFSARSVYTPQAVVNGRLHLNGAKRAALEGALSSLEARGEGLQVPVSVERKGEGIVIRVGAGADKMPETAHVTLVYYGKPEAVDIKGGENDGRKLYYVNPVTGIQVAGMWHGEAATFELPASEIARKGPGGCAVLLQSVGGDGEPGPILGAADLPAEPLAFRKSRKALAGFGLFGQKVAETGVTAP